jgi:hypothetical protein
MSPVLGIIASSTQQGRGGGPVGAYDALATINVPSGGLASVIFAGIPAGYEHLQIRMITIGNTSAAAGGALYFNSDTTSTNYYTHYIIGNGTTITPGANQATFSPFTVGVSASPAVGIIDILDYASTTKRKVIKEFNGYDANGAGRVNFTSTLWNNLSAINSIRLDFSTFQQYTQFALYGVK